MCSLFLILDILIDVLPCCKIPNTTILRGARDSARGVRTKHDVTRNFTDTSQVMSNLAQPPRVIGFAPEGVGFVQSIEVQLGLLPGNVALVGVLNDIQLLLATGLQFLMRSRCMRRITD